MYICLFIQIMIRINPAQCNQFTSQVPSHPQTPVLALSQLVKETGVPPSPRGSGFADCIPLALTCVSIP